jgi:hypothetical protein
LCFARAVVIVDPAMSESSRRAVYRIVYPLAERPTFETGRFLFEVIDCSENGIRYEVRDRRIPAVGTELGGKLVFRRGEEVEIQGLVLRAQSGVVVLSLDPPLPFAEVLAEQRYLRSKGYVLKE